MTAAPGGTALAYDPMDRLAQFAVAGTTTRFLYDGVEIVGEYDAGGALLRRFVPGPALDEPILWYEGSGTSDRRWLLADQMGSVVAVSNGAGAATNINTYDEYGQPGASNAGRFQFTGAPWLAEAGLLHLRARAYDPALGRFLQTDPILTGGGLNLYAYVGNDPVNAIDPSGLRCIVVVVDEIYPNANCADDSSLAEFNTVRGEVNNGVRERIDVERSRVDVSPDDTTQGTVALRPRPAPSPPRLPPFLRFTPFGVFIWVLAPQNTAIDDCSQGGEGCRRIGRAGPSDEECEAEWADALAICARELSRPNPNRGITGGYRTIGQCARGLVSEACGGNRVDWGRRN